MKFVRFEHEDYKGFALFRNEDAYDDFMKNLSQTCYYIKDKGECFQFWYGPDDYDVIRFYDEKELRDSYTIMKINEMEQEILLKTIWANEEELDAYYYGPFPDWELESFCEEVEEKIEAEK